MRVCQPVVDNIRKVFEVGENLLDAARDPLLTLLEWRRRLMFGRDGFAVQKVFKELFFGLFCWWWLSAFRQQRNRRYNDQNNATKFERRGYFRPLLLANLGETPSLPPAARAVLRQARGLGEGRARVHRKIRRPRAKA